MYADVCQALPSNFPSHDVVCPFCLLLLINAVFRRLGQWYYRGYDRFFPEPFCPKLLPIRNLNFPHDLQGSPICPHGYRARRR